MARDVRRLRRGICGARFTSATFVIVDAARWIAGRGAIAGA
jgi:hypothetical protein